MAKGQTKDKTAAGADNTPAVSATPAQNTNQDFATGTLSDGRKVVVRQGKGKHSNEATRLCGDDPSAYMMALLSILTEIDGQRYPLEYYEEMPHRDYSVIQMLGAPLNF